MSGFNFFKKSDDAFKRSRGTFKFIERHPNYTKHNLKFPKSPNSETPIFDFFVGFIINFIDMVFPEQEPVKQWQKYKKPTNDNSEPCSAQTGDFIKKDCDEIYRELLESYYYDNKNRRKFSRAEWKRFRDKDFFLGAWYDMDNEDFDYIDKINKINKEIENGFSKLDDAEAKDIHYKSVGSFKVVPNYYTERCLNRIIKLFSNKPK